METVLVFVKAHYVSVGLVYLFIGLLVAMAYLALHLLLNFTAGVTGIVVNAALREKVVDHKEKKPSFISFIFCLLAWPLVPVYILVGLVFNLALSIICEGVEWFVGKFSEFQPKKK